MADTRTYWLSFCDPDRPEGDQFLGVAIVDVPAAAAAAALPVIDKQFPHHAPGAEWNAAAIRIAHAMGCNPGGQVLYIDITDDVPSAPLVKHRLLSFAELEALGLKPVKQDTA